MEPPLRRLQTGVHQVGHRVGAVADQQLDIDPVAGAARITRSLDRIERAGDEFHLTVRAAFLARAAADRSGRWLVLDATRTPAELHADVVARAEGLLGSRSRVTPPPGGAS